MFVKVNLIFLCLTLQDATIQRSLQRGIKIKLLILVLTTAWFSTKKKKKKSNCQCYLCEFYLYLEQRTCKDTHHRYKKRNRICLWIENISLRLITIASDKRPCLFLSQKFKRQKTKLDFWLSFFFFLSLFRSYERLPSPPVNETGVLSHLRDICWSWDCNMG